MRVLVAVMTAVLVMWAAAPPAAAGGAWVWPVEGQVLTTYSNDNSRPYAGGMHRGIDIAAGVGARVVAARAGTVTHAGVVGSAGLVVAVRTVDGRYVTSYLHLSEAAVREGEAVTAGARIGTVGTSGRRSVPEPHLHFGVRLAREDRYVDPLSLLPAGAATPAAPAAPLVAPVPVGPAPERVRQPVAVPVRRAPRPFPQPAPHREPGLVMVLAGLCLLAVVLFGGVAWRVLARTHREVNARAGATAGFLRDRVRTGTPLRRILQR
jgi:peptidase M23-like protein